MRTLYSADTHKKMFPLPDGKSEFKTDIQVFGDGEGGVYFGMCWHELRELGSVAVHWTPEQAERAIKLIREAMDSLD